jgi:hypothetical protein
MECGQLIFGSNTRDTCMRAGWQLPFAPRTSYLLSFGAEVHDSCSFINVDIFLANYLWASSAPRSPKNGLINDSCSSSFQKLHRAAHYCDAEYDRQTSYSNYGHDIWPPSYQGTVIMFLRCSHFLPEPVSVFFLEAYLLQTSSAFFEIQDLRVN